jgi:hypothetical protein
MWPFLLSLILFQASSPAPSSARALDSPAPSRAAFESVVNVKGGKEIGTTILLEFSSPAPGSAVTGWIQKHDFFPIDGGQVTATGFTFQAAGNTYQINTRTGRLVYGGADGSGDKRLNPMEAMLGRVYKIREETDEGRELTLQTDHGDVTMLVDQQPVIWKHSGAPIPRFHLDRLEEVLGKNTTVWRTREGGTYTVELIEEPEGMDIPARLPKEKDKKKKD